MYSLCLIRVRSSFLKKIKSRISCSRNTIIPVYHDSSIYAERKRLFVSQFNLMKCHICFRFILVLCIFKNRLRLPMGILENTYVETGLQNITLKKICLLENNVLFTFHSSISNLDLISNTEAILNIVHFC